VIITPAALMAAAQPLADHRSAHGVPSLVVDLADVRDTFNHGLAEPRAIAEFLRYARQQWTPPLHYAVLGGDGTYDYMNLLGRNDNVVPPQLTRTPFGLYSSDASLGDVDGDPGSYEVAVGRLPAMTTTEMTTCVGKIISYETGGSAGWPLDAWLAADAADDGGDFPADSEALAAGPLAGLALGRAYLSELPLATARSQTFAAIHGGTVFLNWIGHGGIDRLSRSALLRSADVPSLTNATRLPIVTAATCVIGQFEIPGFDCLAERLLLRVGGGAVAVWAPSALAYNDLSNQLGTGFYRAVYQDGVNVVGDAVLSALNAYLPPADPTLYGGMDARRIYNLIGDPATIVQRRP
jgi:hypothetical protein